MAEPISFDPPRAESASLVETPSLELDTIPGAVGRCFEFSCRGDRVPLTFIAPESGAPTGTAGTLLVQPTPGEGSGLAGLRGLRSWLGAGVTVASIELPLFDSRRSAKFSDKLVGAFADAARGDPIDTTSRILWSEFVRQSVLEMRRALDVLAEIQGASDSRVVFAGVGIAAYVGAVLCAVDERIAGAVLVGAGCGFGPEEVDPASYVADVAPRPLLLVSREGAAPTPGAPAMPSARSDALYEAAGDSAVIETQTGDDADLLGSAWKVLSPLVVPA
jgi:hypothetical protein